MERNNTTSARSTHTDTHGQPCFRIARGMNRMEEKKKRSNEGKQ
jgi:hypothetical protein